MARISLQVKNIASILLAASASAASGITVKKVVEGGRWAIPAACLALALLVQLALIFVESKEEEELSLPRTQRLDRSRHSIEENTRISAQIVKSIEAGDPESALKWHEVRRTLDDE